MEFAAAVRSVLKLSAGIQLALRSSRGRARLPLPAGTGTHRHVHSWQASPKTCEKPHDSWMLLSQDVFKRGKHRKKGRKDTFSCVLSQGHLGQLRKVYSICCPKHYLWMFCMMPRTLMCVKSLSKKRQQILPQTQCRTVYTNYIQGERVIKQGQTAEWRVF